MALIFKAKWGLNSEGFFQKDAWYLVENNKILKFGVGEIPTGYTVKILPEGVVIPGFVNSHTHLELSPFARKQAGIYNNVHEFAEYVMENNTASVDESLKWAEKLVKEALDKGTFYFADISNNIEFSRKVKNIPGFSGIRFLELLGFASPNDTRRIENAKQVINPQEIYITPHSVYGSSPEIMKFSSANNKEFVSIHLMEEEAEKEIFIEKGITWDFLKKINQSVRHSEIYNNDIADYLKIYFEKIKKILFVHLLTENQELLKKLKKYFPQSAVVICNRSNKTLSYRRHNWQFLKNLELPVLLGTDSAASAENVSIIYEINDLIQEGEMPENFIWKAATFNAYNYFEILDVPWFFYMGANPDIKSILNSRVLLVETSMEY